jgi:hypothetical protein
MTGNICCWSYIDHTKSKASDMDKAEMMIGFVGLGFLRRISRSAASANDISPAPIASTTPTELMKNIPPNPIGG